MAGPHTPPSDDLSVRRKRAARTAMVMAAIALAVYVGFIVMGVIGS